MSTQKNNTFAKMSTQKTNAFIKMSTQKTSFALIKIPIFTFVILNTSKKILKHSPFYQYLRHP